MKKSIEVKVGKVIIGGGNPIVIQSMCNTDTMDTMATVDQTMRLLEKGCQMVRITSADEKQAANLYNIKNELIKRGCNVPLVADIHFNPKSAEIAASIVEKIRINPGNYVDRRWNTSFTEKDYEDTLKRAAENINPLIEICKKHNTAIRIGVNHGSLSERILYKYGNTPMAMAQSCLEYLHIFQSLDFHNIVVSLKASDVKVMYDANVMLHDMMHKENMYYPFHLGVTEAGNGEDGRTKSISGIASLLLRGIGDTIRVSLTEKPENEIQVCKDILQAVGLQRYKAEFVACPSCGRTKYNIEEALEKVKTACNHLKGLKIAVMGCIVNGPGEMADADYGYIGAGNNNVNLYRGKNLVYTHIEENDAINKLISMIKEDGKWIDKE